MNVDVRQRLLIRARVVQLTTTGNLRKMLGVKAMLSQQRKSAISLDLRESSSSLNKKSLYTIEEFYASVKVNELLA